MFSSEGGRANDTPPPQAGKDVGKLRLDRAGQDRTGQDRTAGGGRQDKTGQGKKGNLNLATIGKLTTGHTKDSCQCEYGEETAGGESGVPGPAGCQGPGQCVLWKYCQVRERHLRGPQRSSQVLRGPQGSSEFLRGALAASVRGEEPQRDLVILRGSPSLVNKLPS